MRSPTRALLLACALLWGAPARAQESDAETPRFPAATAAEEQEIRDCLARIPVPEELRDALGLGTTSPAAAAPGFDEDPAFHLADTDEERERIRREIAAMPAEQKTAFLEKKRKEWEEKRENEARERAFEDPAFADEGVGPRDMTDEEFRKHYEKMREKRERDVRAQQAAGERIRAFTAQRTAAVARLKELGSKAVPFLAPAFREADLDTGSVLVDVVAGLPGDARAHPDVLAWLDRLPFQAFLKDESFLGRLGRCRIEGLLPALERALQRADGRNRGAFLRAYHAACVPENAGDVADAYLRFLKSGDRRNGVVALNFLILLVSDANVPEGTRGDIIRDLSATLPDPAHETLVLPIAAALGKADHDAAVGPLSDLLRVRDPRVVRIAIQSLGLLGPRAAQSARALHGFLDPRVPLALRREAVGALGRIKNSESVWPLIDAMALEDLPLDLRQEVVRALMRITGKNLGSDPERWTNWWTAEEDRRARGE